MISALSTMLTCRWAARRVHRYLDVDPAAPLEPAEIRRLEAHLATCARCSAALDDLRGLRRVLAGWTQRRDPDPAAVARLQMKAAELLAEDAR